MRKIAIITGSRGEYGYIRPLMKSLQQDKELKFEVIATNMHLLPEFGSSIDEFEKDRLKIDYKIYNTIDGYNLVTMVKSLGLFLLQLPEILEKASPDIVLVSGDRGEQLMAAIAAAHMNIPVAHIQAGEVSGNIDGSMRHAITKISHIHFASNKDAYERVIRLGEEPSRVHNVGAPLVDELTTEGFTDPDIRSKYNIPEGKLFLAVMHPVTEEFGTSYSFAETVLSAINEFDSNVVLILPNSDAGSGEVRRAINANKKSNYHVFKNLSRSDYASLLKECDVMVGNSSSGIMEAPTFRKPVVNIGRRQEGRQQASNVINTPVNKDLIEKAIREALSEGFKKRLSTCVNPYGDGRSSERIIKILKDIRIDDKLLVKKITY